MPVIDRKNVLSGLMVREAMRKLVTHLPMDASIEQAARYAIKYKVNAILITGEKLEAIGVVSKTDLMGAYYAGLPVETAVQAIMVGPPMFCQMDDSLESALDTMRNSGIHRLYVVGDTPNRAAGVLAYPDIVGLLYRYCHKCEKSITRLRGTRSSDDLAGQLMVREVMSPSVLAHGADDTLLQVMEGLASHRFGAVLIRESHGLPAGVVSKTDMVIAYKHRIPTEAKAREIMAHPVHACEQDEPLAMAIQKMIFSDIHRLFVYKEHPHNIIGVLSLTDAARVRSGSCRACTSSRIIEDGPRG
ncbi:MAG: CBS domain-containing protein [Desulfobacterales bacterium]|nr:CBS domain-containing protein [Desulfobacterales bacterium]